VLHATYVYLASARFWLAVYQDGDVTGEQRDYARDRLIRYPLQLRVGEAVLDDYSQWTDHGRELFRRMEASRRELAEAVEAAGVPYDAPAVICDDFGVFSYPRNEDGSYVTARRAVARHLERWDTTDTGKAAIASHGIDL
jgi:hypothetical protein